MLGHSTGTLRLCYKLLHDKVQKVLGKCGGILPQKITAPQVRLEGSKLTYD